MKKALFIFVAALVALAVLVPAAQATTNNTPYVGYFSMYPDCSAGYTTFGLWGCKEVTDTSNATWTPYADPTAGESEDMATLEDYLDAYPEGLGTDFTLYYRLDGGSTWTEFRQNKRTHYKYHFNEYTHFAMTAGELYEYYYTIEENIGSSPYEMTTVPASGWFHYRCPPDDDDGDDFQVVAYGDNDNPSYPTLWTSSLSDTQTEEELWSWAATVTDPWPSESPNPDTNFDGVDLAINTGDALKENLESAEEIDNALRNVNVNERYITSAMQIIRAPGDNENFWDNIDTVSPADDADGDLYQEAVGDVWFKGRSPDSVEPQFWNEYEFGDVHFITLATAIDEASYHKYGWIDESGEQWEWLNDTLDAITGTGENMVDDNIVIVMHQPLKRGKSGTNTPWADMDKDYPTTDDPDAYTGWENREHLLEIFAEHGVDLILTGHTHLYRKSLIEVTKNSTTYYIPQIQVPSIHSNPRDYTTEEIAGYDATSHALSSDEDIWALDDSLIGGTVDDSKNQSHSGSTTSDFHGLVLLDWDASANEWQLFLFKGANDGTGTDPTEVHRDYHEHFSAVPSGCDYDHYPTGGSE